MQRDFTLVALTDLTSPRTLSQQAWIARSMSTFLDTVAPPDLSIILPALKVDADYMRCIASIRAACANSINFEIVSVVRDLTSFDALAGTDLRIMAEERPGIYAAMNLGLEKAIGTYVYFIGQDDILLPVAADALRRGSLEGADLILADVYWGTGLVYKNKPSPRSLIWKNWCHQGVIYRRDFVRDCKVFFNENFKTQSDHYFNIVITAGHRASIVKIPACIAWYSAQGASTVYRDLDFRTYFPQLIRENFGFFSFLIVTFRRGLLSLFRMVIPR